MSITRDNIIDALKTIYDPEIPVNIWDLGLIYNIYIGKKEIVITMTFTSPTCPMIEEILTQVKENIDSIACGIPVRVELVWNPPWNLSKMSDAARLELDLTDQGW